MRLAVWVVLAGVAPLLAACGGSYEKVQRGSFECEINGRYYFASHPKACAQEGGRAVDPVPANGQSASLAVKVGWQGRDEITTGQLTYSRFGDWGDLRLELPEAGDVCEGTYRLKNPYDATWNADCESGRTVRGNLFLRQVDVAISAQGKDGDGRSVGFFPLPPES